MSVAPCRRRRYASSRWRPSSGPATRAGRRCGRSGTRSRGPSSGAASGRTARAAASGGTSCTPFARGSRPGRGVRAERRVDWSHRAPRAPARVRQPRRLKPREDQRRGPRVGPLRRAVPARPTATVRTRPTSTPSGSGGRRERAPHRADSAAHRRRARLGRHPRVGRDAMSAYLTVNECAALLAVDHKTIRRLIERGELPALRVGRVLRIARDNLDELRYRPGPSEPGSPARRRPRPVNGEFSRRARDP